MPSPWRDFDNTNILTRKITCYHLNIFHMLCFFFFSASAINCYQCNSDSNPECTNLHEHPPHNVSVFYQSCDGDFDGLEPFCRTITYKCQYFSCGKFNQNLFKTSLLFYFFYTKIAVKFLKSSDARTNRVIRSCAHLRSQRECYSADNDHHLENVCQCFTDGCNNSDRLSAKNLFPITISIFCIYMFLLN